MAAETIERLSSGISDYVESFSVEDLKKIENGKMIVSFAAGCSDDIVHGEQETLGKKYTVNLELAKIRVDLVEELGRKFLAEKGISNPIVIIDIPNVEGLEPRVSKNNERFASMKVFELNNQNMAKNYDLIIIDPSGSMNDDRAEINKFKDLNAEIIDLDVKRGHGDTKELIYRSVYKAVHGAENGSKIIFITDEGDNSSFDFDKMNKLPEIAETKSIDVTSVMINSDNPNEKINFDYLNMIHAMKDKGGSSGDIKTFNLVKRILDLRRNT